MVAPRRFSFSSEVQLVSFVSFKSHSFDSSNDFIVLSIGQSRDFIFRHKDRREMKVKFNFQDGDIIYMFDNCQEIFEHCLKKSKNDLNDRISLVFKKSKK